MTRWKAAAIHLAISLCVATLVGSLIYFVWYPQPYFQVVGGSSLMILIMSVDIVIGPLLTLVVFKSGKKSLRFDLAVISILQLCAFSYGLSVIVEARPVFIVGRIDRFLPVAAIDLEDADLAEASQPQFSKRSWTGPVLVGAQKPTDQKEQQDMLFSGLKGKDLERVPKYFKPFAEVADAMLAKAHPLADLASKSQKNDALIRDFLASHPDDPSQYVYLPLHGTSDEYSMVLSRKTKLPIGVLRIDAW